MGWGSPRWHCTPSLEQSMVTDRSRSCVKLLSEAWHLPARVLPLWRALPMTVGDCSRCKPFGNRAHVSHWRRSSVMSCSCGGVHSYDASWLCIVALTNVIHF